jgi:hypothetical protein
MPKLVSICIDRPGGVLHRYRRRGRVWRGALWRSRAEADYLDWTPLGVPEGTGTMISAISARILLAGSGCSPSERRPRPSARGVLWGQTASPSPTAGNLLVAISLGRTTAMNASRRE